MSISLCWQKFTSVIQGTQASCKKLPLKYSEEYYTNATAFYAVDQLKKETPAFHNAAV